MGFFRYSPAQRQQIAEALEGHLREGCTADAVIRQVEEGVRFAASGLPVQPEKQEIGDGVVKRELIRRLEASRPLEKFMYHKEYQDQPSRDQAVFLWRIGRGPGPWRPLARYPWLDHPLRLLLSEIRDFAEIAGRDPNNKDDLISILRKRGREEYSKLSWHVLWVIMQSWKDATEAESFRHPPTKCGWNYAYTEKVFLEACLSPMGFSLRLDSDENDNESCRSIITTHDIREAIKPSSKEYKDGPEEYTAIICAMVRGASTED